MVRTASLLARSVKGGGGGGAGGGLFLGLDHPMIPMLLPQGWGWGDQMRRTSPTSSEMRQSLSPILNFFSRVFVTVCLDWMLHDPDSRVARMMCHLFIPFFFSFFLLINPSSAFPPRTPATASLQTFSLCFFLSRCMIFFFMFFLLLKMCINESVSLLAPSDCAALFCCF